MRRVGDELRPIADTGRGGPGCTKSYRLLTAPGKARLILSGISRQLLEFNDVITNGIPHQAGKRAQLQLKKDPRTIAFHCLYADI